MAVRVALELLGDQVVLGAELDLQGPRLDLLAGLHLVRQLRRDGSGRERVVSCCWLFDDGGSRRRRRGPRSGAEARRGSGIARAPRRAPRRARGARRVPPDDPRRRPPWARHPTQQTQQTSTRPHPRAGPNERPRERAGPARERPARGRRGRSDGEARRARAMTRAVRRRARRGVPRQGGMLTRAKEKSRMNGRLSTVRARAVRLAASSGYPATSTAGARGTTPSRASSRVHHDVAEVHAPPGEGSHSVSSSPRPPRRIHLPGTRRRPPPRPPRCPVAPRHQRLYALFAASVYASMRSSYWHMDPPSARWANTLNGTRPLLRRHELAVV